MKSLASLALLASTALAKTGLLVPFYEYPSATVPKAQEEWRALFAAIDAHPQLDFYVVVNILNGPPTTPNPPPEIKDWAPWLGGLNLANRTNVHPIGYIYTSQSARSYDEIKAGVDQYASWTTTPGWDGIQYDIHVEGIFFDEINTQAPKLDNNTRFTEYAKSVFGSRGGPVVLNPGGTVDPASNSLFNIADTIVQIETCYTTVEGPTDNNGNFLCPKDSYRPFNETSLTLIDDSEAAKSSVLVHDFYETWDPYVPAPEAKLDQYIRAIVAKGVHSFYVAQYDWRGNFTSEPASIANNARIAAAAQGLA